MQNEANAGTVPETVGHIGHIPRKYFLASCCDIAEIIIAKEYSRLMKDMPLAESLDNAIQRIASNPVIPTEHDKQIVKLAMTDLMDDFFSLVDAETEAGKVLRELVKRQVGE